MGKLPQLRFPEFQDAGDWKEKLLIKSCEINPSVGSLPEKFIYIDLESVVSGNLLFKKEIYKKEAPSRAQRLLKNGDVIYQMVRPYQKNNLFCNFTDDNKYVASTGYAQLRAFESSKFLFQVIHTDAFVNKVLSQSTGSNYPAINSKDLAKINLYIPSPLEQQKIANCLTSLDQLITTHAQKLDTLKAHKKGLMQQLFPAEGKTVPNYRFPEFRDAGDWEEITLIKLAKFRRGSFPQPYGLPEWYDDENGIPFVQVFDVSDEMRLKETTKRRISKLATKQSVYIPKGTLIVTIQGSIGRVAITQYDAYIDRTLLLFERFYKSTDKPFLSYVLQNLFKIEKEKAPGGIIKTITKEVLSSFIVKLPQLQEQQKIANCLTSLDQLITAQANKIASLKAHKKGLMQQLFPSTEEVDG